MEAHFSWKLFQNKICDDFRIFMLFWEILCLLQLFQRKNMNIWNMNFSPFFHVISRKRQEFFLDFLSSFYLHRSKRVWTVERSFRIYFSLPKAYRHLYSRTICWRQRHLETNYNQRSTTWKRVMRQKKKKTKKNMYNNKYNLF